MKKNLQLGLLFKKFSYIKNTSEKFLKKSIDNCVLTVPAYFDEKARSEF